MRKRPPTALFAALLAGTMINTPGPAAAAGDGRLLYEMVVTNPGTRSQGWHGTLFGPDGVPREAAADAVVETGVGDFRNVPCDLPWKPCGFIRLGTPPHPATSIDALMDSEAWRFRLYVHAEGSRSEGWRGVLLHGANQAMPAVDPVDTPLGPFYYAGESNTPWGWSGWVPGAWER